MSLKLARQEKNKVVTAVKNAVDKRRGRTVKMNKMGNSEINLKLPFGILAEMK